MPRQNEYAVELVRDLTDGNGSWHQRQAERNPQNRNQHLAAAAIYRRLYDEAGEHSGSKAFFEFDCRILLVDVRECDALASALDKYHSQIGMSLDPTIEEYVEAVSECYRTAALIELHAYGPHGLH